MNVIQMIHSSLILLVYLLTLSQSHYALADTVYPLSPQSNPPSQWESMSGTFKRHCSPFGVSVFAQGWPEDKFVHACNVLAQMLDNDQDGCADDAKVVNNLRKFRSGMAMFENENTMEKYADKIPQTFRWQNLFATETEPTCSGSSETKNCRDAAIEEIFHIVSGAGGLSVAYPDVFGECKASGDDRSKMQVQMDIARGGHFETVPKNYPSGAIYHYTDKTCDYNCMGTEFIYWGLTSLLGGQDQRAADNMEEWEASTAEVLKKKLKGMYKLLTDGKTTSLKLISLQGELPGSGGSTFGARETYNPSSQTCSMGCGLDGSGCGSMPTGENNADTCSVSNSCEDNSKFKKKKNGKVRKCKWFGKKPEKRCKEKEVVDNCKVSCDTCGNGEDVCERRGKKKLNKKACKAISCCDWDNVNCWSSVGEKQCWG